MESDIGSFAGSASRTQISLAKRNGSERITFKGDASRGVGLVHAFERVKTLGGKVQLRSGLGQGTVLIITLPRDMVDRIGNERITFKGDSSRGVGLMHAFGRVKRIGGKVEVHSALGEGTSVLIRIPHAGHENSYLKHGVEQKMGERNV